jgi:uncharacterized membrane protein YhiD involved in acid resistance
VAAVGAACGYGLYPIASYVTVLTLFIFEVLWYVEERFVRKADRNEDLIEPMKKHRHETED